MGSHDVDIEHRRVSLALVLTALGKEHLSPEGGRERLW